MDNVHHNHVFIMVNILRSKKIIFDGDYLVADEILILGSYDIDLNDVKSSTP